MNLKKLGMICAALMLAAPMWATSTYYGGFEDTKGGDYDYNDIVFTLTGTDLTLNSAATYHTKPALLDNSGIPFWNNLSGDSPSTADNIGYCIYGGGGCNGGAPIATPGTQYLAANNTTKTGSANDVTFSVVGNVGAAVILTITADKDQLGWYNVSSPGTLHFLNTGGSTGTFTFTPGGNFGLVGNNGLGDTFYSVTSTGGTSDTVSHFAFFAQVPEPGATALMAAGLLTLGAMFRRRRAAR